ncbi:MAG TPA: carbon-nitrogen hydrolase family protein [Solirubrobacteraceae bacterium]|nr:carbon-nitrogen hydrolase family protein [Solirubrobacteraceae bacterium]
MRVAAIQLEAAIGDVEANLRACEALVAGAVAEGARLVGLPEFFTTGATFEPGLADAALPPEGAACEFLRTMAGEHGIHIGGSFLCRDPDGEVRNAYLLAGPGGGVLGRHNKDLPTMWENAFYVGGSDDDDGVIEAEDFTAGAAVCWEYMRSATARRLRGRVDVVVGGSNWWSVPLWPPRVITRRMAAANARNAARAPLLFARLVGAPVVHGSICGEISCALPEAPGLTYRGRFVGGALIADSAGTPLAVRPASAGPGHVIAEIDPRRSAPLDPIPDRYWLYRRGPIPTLAWHTERIAGRRWYRRHVRGR